MKNCLDLLILSGISDNKFDKSKNFINDYVHNSQNNDKIEKNITKEKPIESDALIVKSDKKLFTIEENTQLMIQIKIHNDALISNIMNVYLDKENRDIFDCLKKPLTIQEIITACKIPTSSGYRRVSFLLKSGYVRISGYQKKLGKKSKSTKYEKTIQNMLININENSNTIILHVKENIIKGSKFYSVMKN